MMATIGITRARIVRPVVVAIVMLGLAAALSLVDGAARPVTATTPNLTAATTEDVIAVVRGGIASPLVPGEPLALSGDVVATIAVKVVPQTRYARTLIVTLANAAGAVDGGTIQVNAHMRYMDHGSFAAQAVREGAGRYVVALPFVMPGEWELVVAGRTGIDSGEVVIDLGVFD
jgi:hypothetical protein